MDKAVDVLATFIQKEGTVYDLEEAELCYGGCCCSKALHVQDSLGALVSGVRLSIACCYCCSCCQQAYMGRPDWGCAMLCAFLFAA